MKINNKWFKKKWVSYTIATCSAVLLYMFLSHFTTIIGAINSFFSFLRPIIIAIVIAYIVNPVARLFEGGIFSKIKKEKTKWKLSVALAIIVILLSVTLLFLALIPQIVESVSTLVMSIGDYIDSSQNSSHSLISELKKSSFLAFLGVDFAALEDLGDNILNMIGDYFTANALNLVSGSVSAGKGMVDLALAFILAIYFLLDKKRLIKGISKFMSLVMKDKTYKRTCDVTDKCNAILIRYISFDIIDGIVVGIVNFIYMLIAGQPYAVLISVIVGITNLAPTFGPIVGCAIGVFILVLINPWYALWFIIFTIVLQTIDAYILKPRLFGESLGVSPIMILISIILGGRLFQVVGILLAIPVAAIIDFVWKDYVIKKLEEKKSERYNI